MEDRRSKARRAAPTGVPKDPKIEETVKNPSRKDQDEANLLSPVKPMMSKFVLIGAMNLAPD